MKDSSFILQCSFCTVFNMAFLKSHIILHSNKFTKGKMKQKSQWHATPHVEPFFTQLSVCVVKQVSRNALQSETGRWIQGWGSALYNPQKAQSCYRWWPTPLLRQTGTVCRTPAGRSPPLEQPTWKTPETKTVWYPVTWPLFFPCETASSSSSRR